MYRSDITAVELIQTLIWYEFSCPEFLLPLLETVVTHINDDTSLSAYDTISAFGEEIYVKDYFGEELFGMLVLLYGDYGIRPSVGWIDDLRGFKKLITQLIRWEAQYG